MPPLLTIDDIAEMLIISRSSAYALKKKDAWPHVLVGCRVRFTTEHLEEIVRLYTKQPQPAERRPRIGTRATRGKK